MELTSILLGMFFGGFVCMLIGGLWFAFHLINKAKYKYRLNIYCINNGTVSKESYDAEKTLHPILGECYQVPKLKKMNREFVPCFGASTELPAPNNGSVKYIVDLTYLDNTYAPMVFEPMEKRKYSRYEMIKTADGKLEPRMIEKEYTDYKIMPTKNTARQFVVFHDTHINQEYARQKSWMEKYGAMAVGAAILFAVVAISVMILIFTTEAQKNINTSNEEVYIKIAEILGNSTARDQSAIAPPTNLPNPFNPQLPNTPTTV